MILNRLRDLRQQAGMTQKELGERVCVSRQAINALETGKHEPSLDLAYRLAAVFDLSTEEIFPNPHRPERRG